MKNLLLSPPRFLYEKIVINHKDAISFTILLFFLISFIIARLYIYLSIIGHVPPSLTENIRGVHVHHFAWGILLNSIIGYTALVIPRHLYERWKIKLAALFGIGLGLTFDEFGMWIHLTDEYIIRQGYDAIIVIGILFLNVIYFGNLWKRLIKRFLYRK
ncbi:MAG TPA: hypothetical protein VK338_05930 [Candidatus Nitrosocosmicus sp.]|nr:hypothetical protein [Candidatus Nitrosocosmicus sp.]